MAAKAFLKRYSIVVGDGWVALAGDPTVLDMNFQAANTGEIKIRYGGEGAGALLTGHIFPLHGVDLQDLEISTSSETDEDFLVIGSTM